MEDRKPRRMEAKSNVKVLVNVYDSLMPGEWGRKLIK